MSTNGNQMAFAHPGAAIDRTLNWVELAESQPGLTKREYFAACALQGICAKDVEASTCARMDLHKFLQSAADYSVLLADKLIDALNKEVTE